MGSAEFVTEAFAVLEELGRECFFACLNKGVRLLGIVFDCGPPQRVAFLVVFEGVFIQFIVLERLAKREEELHPRLDAQIAAFKLCLHLADIRVCELECLEVGKAPIASAQLRKQFDSLAIGEYAFVLFARGLQRVAIAHPGRWMPRVFVHKVLEQRKRIPVLAHLAKQ